MTRDLKYVSGVVTDASGNPLPGTTLLIKGDDHGNGYECQWRVQDRCSERRGMYVDFFIYGNENPIYVKVGNKTKIDVKMEEDLTEVEEVVVTGYQNIDKRHLTSAVSSVKASDILTPV